MIVLMCFCIILSGLMNHDRYHIFVSMIDVPLDILYFLLSVLFSYLCSNVFDVVVTLDV
jgi:hypothetical protein